jgi:hypothetical protein
MLQQNQRDRDAVDIFTEFATRGKITTTTWASVHIDVFHVHEALLRHDSNDLYARLLNGEIVEVEVRMIPKEDKDGED